MPTHAKHANDNRAQVRPMPLMTLDTLAALGATVRDALADPRVLRAYKEAYLRVFRRRSVMDRPQPRNGGKA